MSQFPAHDEFCPPGLKYDDATTCVWCITLNNARTQERARFADTLFGLAERVMP